MLVLVSNFEDLRGDGVHSGGGVMVVVSLT